MHLLIENSGYDLLNAGDVAMLRAATERLHADPRVSGLSILTYAPERLALHGIPGVAVSPQGRRQLLQQWNLMGGFHRLVPGPPDRARRMEDWLRSRYPQWSLPVIRRRFRRRQMDIRPIDTFLETVRQADAMVVTGGGFLNDTFQIHAMETLRLAEWFLAAGKPVAFFGQGIGPATNDILRHQLRSVLARCTVIGLREGVYGLKEVPDVSRQQKRVLVTGDDALELVRKHAANQPWSERNRIGVNLRLADYSGVGSQEAEKIFASIRTYAGVRNAQLQPVPISSHERDSDVTSLTRGLELSESQQSLLASVLPPHQLVEWVGHCRVVFTGSYHAAVFALGQGVPVVAVSKNAYYDQKFEGLRAQFKGKGLCIVRPEKLQTPESVAAMADQVIAESEMDHSQLVALAEEQVQSSRDLYERFLSEASEQRGRSRAS